MWFHDLTNSTPQWVLLGNMGIQQMAKDAVCSAEYEQESCSLFCTCSISIDWLQDDSLVVGASVPLKSGRSTKAEKKRRMFDIAFTVLTVNDLFTGGYSASKDTSSSSPLSASHCPSVSVLRSVSDDLAGIRCFPSASRAEEEELKGEDKDRTPVLSAVSVVIWAGSQLAVVSFSMERFFFSEGCREGKGGRVTPVTALFTDDVGSRGPLISVDIVHYSVSVTNDHVSTHTDVPPSSSSLAVHSNLPEPPSGVVRASVQSTLLQPHSALAALDSFGMFKCIYEHIHVYIQIHPFKYIHNCIDKNKKIFLFILGNIKMALIPLTDLKLTPVQGRGRTYQPLTPPKLTAAYAKIPTSSSSGTIYLNLI